MAVGDHAPTGGAEPHPRELARLPRHFTNQGDFDEANIQVVLRIEGAGAPIRVTRTVQSVPQGAQAEATLALNKTPPVDQPVTVRVDVKPVPGEKNTDNNTATYDAIFTQQ